ncbi:MAG: GNAT family N-acetyltransferase [Dehalococcoidia bacterium]
MSIDLRRPASDDLPQLARICHEAFSDLAERHGFPSDFPTVEIATGLLGTLMSQEQVYSVAAYDDGVPRGSNYLNLWGDAAGVGPVSVDIPRQGHGVGGALMRDVIEHAHAQGFEMVRLCQDSFNMRSLALYASLGFETKEPLALLALSPGGAIDPAFRPATPADFAQMDALCQSIYRISRRGEYDVLASAGFPMFVLDRGRVSAYLIGTLVGHGVAETDEDMLALLDSAGASTPDGGSFIPIRQAHLYRKALAAGHRNVKVMNLMTLGPYEEPQGTWLPSVFL